MTQYLTDLTILNVENCKHIEDNRSTFRWANEFTSAVYKDRIDVLFFLH